MAEEKVNHPQHYNTGKIEVIDFIEDQRLNFSRGNAIKYIARAEHKGNEIEDLKKALWYIQREIKRLSVQREIKRLSDIHADELHATLTQQLQAREVKADRSIPKEKHDAFANIYGGLSTTHLWKTYPGEKQIRLESLTNDFETDQHFGPECERCGVKFCVHCYGQKPSSMWKSECDPNEYNCGAVFNRPGKEHNHYCKVKNHNETQGNHICPICNMVWLG